MRETLLSIGVLMVMATNLHGSEDVPSWPQFRGTAARGTTQAGAYPTEFGPNKNLIWKVPIPGGVSSPCIWNDRIFITAHDSDKDVLETICVKRSDGSILWRKPAEAKKIESVHEVSSPANATPTTDGKRVCVYFASCGLICYDLDGNELWTVPLPLVSSRFGSGTSPILVDDMVVLCRDEQGFRFSLGNRGSYILAVSAETGETVWKTKRPAGMVKYATPVIWRHSSGDQVLMIGSQRLTGYDLKTGKELWWVNDLPPQACATPQVADDTVYVTATGMFGEPETFVSLPNFQEFLKQHDKNGDELLSLDEIPDDLQVIDRRASGGAGNSPLKQFSRGIDRNRDEKIDQQEWEGFDSMFGNFMRDTTPGVFSIRLGGEGDLSKSNIQWHAKKGVAEVPSLLILPDRAFVVRNGGIVHCRDLKTGEDIYRGRLGPAGGYYASPVAAGNQVYFASDRGDVTVISGDSPELQVLARNDLQEPIMATPALVEQKIYIRTDSHLFAFGE